MKLTPTFPANILPVRSGVYKTRYVDRDSGKPIGPWGFSWFDITDRLWGCQSDAIDKAAAHLDYEFASQTKLWRGLVTEK